MKKIVFVAVGLLLLATMVIWANFDLGTLIGSQQKKNDALIAERSAFVTGTQAYIYGYPLVDMYKQMHNETHWVSENQQVYAPLNRLYRYPDLVTPTTAGNLRAPNNDTLYFSGWYDVSVHPLIINTPETRGRYYTIAVTNQFSEVIHIGRRTTGTQQQYFALTGPGWQGQLPATVTRIEVSTPQGWLLGRMLVDGPEDFPEAKALMDDIWLASLPEFTPGQRPRMPEPKTAKAIDPLKDLEFFSVMNRILKTLPLRDGEQVLMKMFDDIGIGPASEFAPSSLNENERIGLEQAIEEGAALVQAATQRTIPDFNGWMISKDIGRYDKATFLHRAAVVKGGYGNLPEESLYPATLFDSQGRLLNGKRQYRLHFPADQLPPVDGFWSLAVYDLMTQQLVPNLIDRYSIGDRTKGLVYGEDGSLTIALQTDRPALEHENWMPTPDGNFMVVIRLYEPRQAALDNSYLLPRIEEREQ